MNKRTNVRIRRTTDGIGYNRTNDSHEFEGTRESIDMVLALSTDTIQYSTYIKPNHHLLHHLISNQIKSNQISNTLSSSCSISNNLCTTKRVCTTAWPMARCASSDETPVSSARVIYWQKHKISSTNDSHASHASGTENGTAARSCARWISSIIKWFCG